MSERDAQSTVDSDLRLRALGPAAKLNVVLVEPEIPPNTGNIARLCAATQCTLHLVHPLGFDVSEKAVRRAGLDYWHLVELRQHESFTSFLQTIRRHGQEASAQEAEAQSSRLHFFSGKAERSYLQIAYQSGDYLIFGKESTGLDESILEGHIDELVAIPTTGAVRSLNLANAVAIATYEALRQLGTLDTVTRGPKS